MRSNIEKKELLAILRKNRTNHRAIFEEAVDGYRKSVIGELENHIERIKSGSLKQVYVSFPKPADHTRDYDRIIQMLEMTEDDVVPVDETSFAQYVLDDWAWKQQFLRTNSAYSSSATAELKSYEEDDI